MQKYIDIVRKRPRWIATGAAVLILVVIFVRLLSGPIRVDDIRPIIISRIENNLPHTHASIGHLDLVWFGDARAVGFRFEDIVITDQHHRIIAKAAHLETALAADSLLLMHLAPARLTAEDFFVAASVSKEGKYDLGYEAHGSPEAIAGLDTFLADLTGRERLGQPVSFARQISLKNGRLRLVQEGASLDWTARVDTIDFTKLHNKLESHVDMAIAEGAKETTLKASAFGEVGLKKATITADISQLTPSHIFPSVGVTRLLSMVHAPVNGLARVDYSTNKGFEGAWLDVQAGSGHVDFGDNRQLFDGARVQATYTSATHTILFKTFKIQAHLVDTDLAGRVFITPENIKAKRDLKLDFDFSGPRLTGRLADDFSRQTLTKVHLKGNFVPRLRQLHYDTVTGLLNGAPLESQGLVYTDEQGRLGADLTAKIKGRFTKEEVFAFWPEDLSHIVRADLIQRIKGGDYANADFVLKAPPGHFEHLENADLRLDFDFKAMGLEIDERMQDASDLQGHGILLGNRFSMDVTGGRLVNVQMSHGTILVPDFRDHTTRTQIGIDAYGSAPDVIEAVDPLADMQLSKHGLNADRLSGDAQAQVNIAFPTFHEITNKNFDVNFKGTIKNAGLKQAALGWDLTGGDLTVDGDLLADRLEVKGPGHLGPYSGDVTYLTQFMPKSQVIDFKGSFNAAQFGGSPRVPVPITGHFIVENGSGHGKVDADIFRGDVAWSGGTEADERPVQLTIQGDTISNGMEAQGLPIFEHLKRELPTRISFVRSGDIWSGEIEAESLSGDLAYIQGQRPRLVYKSVITPDEAREMGYGALPMFKESRHLTVNIALDSDSKEALIKLDQMNAVLGWSEIPGSDDVLRQIKMTAQPDDWATLGLPKLFFQPKKPVDVVALWRQVPGKLEGHADLLGRRIDFDMPTHSYGEATTPTDPATPAPYTLQVRGDLDDTLLQGLGYTQDPVHVQGDLGLVFSLYETPGQPAAVLNIDAGKAVLGIKATDWKKPAGEAAQFSVAFDDQGDQAKAGGLNLSRIFGSGDHVRVDGRASFDAKGYLEFADFSNLYLKDFIDVTFKYYVLPDQRTNVISLSGQQLDLRPWLDSTQSQTAPAAQTVAPASPAAPSENLPTHVVIDLASLKMTDNAAFKNLKFDVNWDGRNGFDGGGSALGDTGSPIVIGLQSEGNYSLFSARIGNLGDVIRTATDNRNLYEGVATFDGAYKDGQFDATLDGKKVRVKQIPVLAQLLTVASLRGLNDTLIGDGIAFSDFNFPIRYRGHSVFIRNGYASGDALGINVWGTTDLDARTVALNGTLIPAYGINSMFGAVKSNGLGLVGLKYDLKGSTKAPTAEVNPLSLVLPGFIKVWAQAGRKDIYPALDLPNYKDKLEKLHEETEKKSVN